MAVTEKCGLGIGQWVPGVREDKAVTEVQTLQTFGLAAGTGQLADGEKLPVCHVELDRHPVGDDEHVQLLRPLLPAHRAALGVGVSDNLSSVGGADDAGRLLGPPEGHLESALDDVLLRRGELPGRPRLKRHQVQSLIEAV